LPGHRHDKLFTGGQCRKRAADLLVKVSQHQLKTAVAVLTEHASVRKHLRTVGLFEGDPTCRLCRKEADSAACNVLLRVLVRQRFDGFGNLVLETKDIRTASVRDILPLHTRHRATESGLNGVFRVAQ
jgi:hypothetical protein